MNQFYYKRYYLIMFLSHVIPLMTFSIQSNFLKSREDELREMAEHYLGPDLDGEDMQIFKNLMLSAKNVSKKSHYGDKIHSLADAIKSMEKGNEKDTRIACTLSDIKKTFEFLRKKMNISAEVKYMLCTDSSLEPEASMSYSSFDRTMYMYPSYLRIPPSCRLFGMVHELTHLKQHMRMGMVKYMNEERHQCECEADTNAAEFIKCPLCMKAIVAYQLLREKMNSSENLVQFEKDGYLTSEKLKEFLQKKSFSDVCNVHASVKNSDILTGLDTKEGCLQILNDDHQNPCIFNRLS